MKAAFYYEPGVIRVEEVEPPRRAHDNELIVRVRAASICGTDQKILRQGHFKIPAGARRILGHEIAGEIVQAGAGVQGFRVGQRVAVTPNVGCGMCELCRAGYNNMCPRYEAFGISLDGGFQEYMRVPGFALAGGNVFPIPDGVSYEEAALTEPFSCAYTALRALGTAHTDTVLVIGPGPMGALNVLVSKIAGARQVIVAGVTNDRLEKIRAFGADVTVNTAEVDLKAAVLELTGGRGVDVAITAVSVPEVASQAVELLAPLGRVNFFAGLGKQGVVPTDLNRVHYRGLRLLGTTGSTNADYAASLALVAEGRAKLRPLVSRTFPLERVDEAFAYAASGEGWKAMIVYP